MKRLIPILAVFVLCACSDEENPQNNTNNDVPDMSNDASDMARVEDGATFNFDPSSDDFFSVPLPDDSRQKADGTFGYVEFPVINENAIGRKWLDAADDLKTGWGVTGGVYTHWDTALDPATLPTTDESVADEWPSVFLMNVHEGSEKRGERLPIECKFTEAKGTHHPQNQLACMSPYGVLRERGETYVLAFTKKLTDADGKPVSTPEKLTELMGGNDIEGVNGTVASGPYVAARQAILDAGLPEDELASFVLFTTYNPVERFLTVSEFYANLPDPVLAADPAPTVIANYTDFVVIEAYYEVPNIQEGEKPYDQPPAGRIIFENGEPKIVRMELLKVFITIPKSPMPDAGFPTLLYMHGSGGTATELMDRSARTSDADPRIAGQGPAANIARYGIAGFAADFDLHDSRFPRNPDVTGLKLYNILDNPRAMIDNFHIASNEVAYHARLMANLEIDATISPDLDAGNATDGMIRFDSDRFAAMGQSMGSMIGTPTMTIPGEIDAFINAGSGGTLIEIAMSSKDPVEIRPILERVLRFRDDESLDRFDIVLNTFQHVFDHMDPNVHARHIIREPHPGVQPRHVFHPSGLEDRYFSPTARAGLSTALGVPLVEPVLQMEAFDFMKWVGRETATQTPVQSNLAGGVTGFVRQYEPAYFEAGHYVMFDKDEAKAQYACFIKSLRADAAPTLYAPENATPENCP